MNPFLKRYIPELIEICKAHKVSKLYAFGSVVTQDKFTDESDVDLAIEIDQTLEPLQQGEMWWQLFDKLPQLFNRKVDIVNTQNLRNKYFIQNLNRTKVTIYE